MKYSEYLQLREILEQNNITLKEFKENDILYEGIIGNAFKSGITALWNLAKKKMKASISKQISSKHTKVLDDKSKEIEDNIIKEFENAKNDPNHYISQLREQTKDFKDRVDQEIPVTVSDFDNKRIKRKDAIQKSCDKKIIKYIDNTIDNASEKVKKAISRKENLTEDDKDDLLHYWQTLMLKIKIRTVTILGKQTPPIIDTQQDVYWPDYFPS